MISHLYPSMADSVKGSFVHSQVKALKEHCHVQVIAPSPIAPFPLRAISGKWKKYSLIPARDSLDGVDVLYPKIIRTPGARFFQFAGRIYHLALNQLIHDLHMQNPFDLIHAQVGYPDGWAAAKIAKQLNLPLVITCHGQELQIIIHKSPKLKDLVGEALNCADRVIVTGPKLFRLAENLIPRQKLTVIPNGVSPLQSWELPVQVQELIQDKYVLLSVANLIEQKGIQHVVEALSLLKARHRDIFLLVVGGGPMLTSLKELARKLDVSDCIYFAGQVPHHQIGGWYNNAHLFVMPSRDEGFGMVYLEAMQAGLPVIGCEGEGIMPLITDKGAGHSVPFNNPACLASTIGQVMADKSGLIKHRARELVPMFSWEDNARHLAEVYQELTGKRVSS